MLNPSVTHLLSTAALQADRLARRYKLQPADRDDTFQEIALDAWRRLDRYRASRGELNAFLGVVTRNHARKIESRLCRRMNHPAVSLQSPMKGVDGITLEDSLTQEDGLLVLFGNAFDDQASSELAIDVSRAISRLSHDMQRLCAFLAHEKPGVARNLSGLSSSGMYRRIEKLRRHFSDMGLGPL